MRRASDSPWRRLGSGLERVNVSSLPPDTPEDSGRVRTNSEARRGETKNLFHSGRHKWLGMVARDPKLPSGASRVAIIIWQCVNATTGYAWPSIAFIARELGSHRATVFRLLDSLEMRGWVTRQSRAGRHGVNHYRIAFGPMDASGQS
jgi:hypothetical protein